MDKTPVIPPRPQELSLRTRRDGKVAEDVAVDITMKLSVIRQSLASLYEVSDSSHRAAPLDGSRGLAVILVFFVHYHALFKAYVAHDPASFAVSDFLETIGHSGVDLFFVLSGYLIYGIVIQKPLRYHSFLWRRLRRIYPTFLGVLAIYLTLYALFPTRNKLPSDPAEASLYVLENIALLPGIFPITPIITVAWTLSYELMFYLTIPLLVAATRMRRWKSWQRIFLFFAASSCYVAYCLTESGRHLRLLMFVAGVLLYEILSRTRIKQRLTRLDETIAILLCLGSLVLIYAIHIHPEPLASVTGNWNVPHTCRDALTAGACFLFCLYCFGFDGALSKLFSRAPLRWLGNMSYSYYLIHGLTLQAVALLLTHWLPPTGANTLLFWAFLPCAFATTLVSATILFALVEKPLSLRHLRAAALPTHGASLRPAPVLECQPAYVQQTVN